MPTCGARRMIRLDHQTIDGARIAIITLDRHEKRNALTPDMLENIKLCADHVHEEQPHPRALVLAGAGDVFCAGFDLSLCRDDDLMMSALLTRLAETIRTLRRLPIPVVASAHGGAVAGGCALLCGADIVITNATAKLGYPVVRLGVSPAVTSPLLRAAVGQARTRERLLDPQLIDGAEALRISLAHECLDRADDVFPRAVAVAASLAAKPRHAIAVTKRWLNQLDGSYEDETLDRALNASLALAGSEEERERLAALWTN